MTGGYSGIIEEQQRSDRIPKMTPEQKLAEFLSEGKNSKKSQEILNTEASDTMKLEELQNEYPLIQYIPLERVKKNLMVLQKYEFFHSPKYLTEELQISKLIGMLYRRPDLDFSLLVKNRNEKQIEELWELHNLVQADIIPTQDLSRYYDNL